MESVTDMRDVCLHVPAYGASATNPPRKTAWTSSCTSHIGPVAILNDLTGDPWPVNTLSTPTACRVAVSEAERQLFAWLSDRLERRFVAGDS